MIYFKSRAEAGRLLAERLAHHREKRPVIMALDEGSALVGAQIALKLRAKLLLYKIRNIYLPNEEDPLAAMDNIGNIKFNNLLSVGQIEEIITEYRNFIEEERIKKFHEMNVLIGHEGIVSRDAVRHHDVIVVADGLPSSFAVSMAAEFLKIVAIRSITAAVPIAARNAADEIHRHADELHILGVIENYINTFHYYDDNTIPSTEDTIRIMSRLKHVWRPVANEH